MNISPTYCDNSCLMPEIFLSAFARMYAAMWLRLLYSRERSALNMATQTFHFASKSIGHSCNLTKEPVPTRMGREVKFNIALMCWNIIFPVRPCLGSTEARGRLLTCWSHRDYFAWLSGGSYLMQLAFSLAWIWLQASGMGRLSNRNNVHAAYLYFTYWLLWSSLYNAALTRHYIKVTERQ